VVEPDKNKKNHDRGPYRLDIITDIAPARLHGKTIWVVLWGSKTDGVVVVYQGWNGTDDSFASATVLEGPLRGGHETFQRVFDRYNLDL